MGKNLKFRKVDPLIKYLSKIWKIALNEERFSSRITSVPWAYGFRGTEIMGVKALGKWKGITTVIHIKHDSLENSDVVVTQWNGQGRMRLVG